MFTPPSTTPLHHVSAMALNIWSKRTSTCDYDEEEHYEAGAHGVQAGVNIEIVRSDDLAAYERLRRDQADKHSAVRFLRVIEALPVSGVL
jgi:head-tail adaptor